MLISDLQQHLEKLKCIHGDIQCVVNIPHDYWGSTQDRIEVNTILVTDAQPDGPKSGVSELCVVFSHY